MPDWNWEIVRDRPTPILQLGQRGTRIECDDAMASPCPIPNRTLQPGSECDAQWGLSRERLRVDPRSTTSLCGRHRIDFSASFSDRTSRPHFFTDTRAVQGGVRYRAWCYTAEAVFPMRSPRPPSAPKKGPVLAPASGISIRARALPCACRSAAPRMARSYVSPIEKTDGRPPSYREGKRSEKWDPPGVRVGKPPLD